MDVDVETVIQREVAVQVAKQLAAIRHEIASLQRCLLTREVARADPVDCTLTDSMSSVAVIPTNAARTMQKLEDTIFCKPPDLLEFSGDPEYGPDDGERLLPQHVTACQEHIWNDAGKLDDASPAGQRQSMLNYCLTRMILSDHPWREPALAYLLVSIASQQALITTYMIGADINASAHVESSVKSISTCVQESTWSLNGMSVMQFIASVFSMFLIAVLAKAKDVEQFEVLFYPRQHFTFGIRAIVTSAFYLQVVYLPSLFCTEAAMRFAVSADALEVIMNSLGVAYILEVDNMLYCNLLNQQQKADYQRDFMRLFHSGIPSHHISWCSWLLFAINMVFMILQYAFWVSPAAEEAVQIGSHLRVMLCIVFVMNMTTGLRAGAQFWMVRVASGKAETLLFCQRLAMLFHVFLVSTLVTGLAVAYQFLSTGIVTGDLMFDTVHLPSIVELCADRLQH